MDLAKYTTIFCTWIIFVFALLCECHPDYYATLGVAHTATQKEIKSAFHKLALQYHPDKNKQPDAEEKFRNIAEGKL